MTTRIATPGIYQMPQDHYHADCCPLPSLSNSIAHILLTQSPAHAKAAHPRLTPRDGDDESSAVQDEGRALHALILEGRDVLDVLDFADYRSKAAQEARAASHAAGRVPVLAKRAPSLLACAAAVRAQLDDHMEAAGCFTDGKPEQVLAWQEDTPNGRIWCRALVDWLPNDPTGWIDDLKTTATSAEPGAWGRRMTTEGYAMQAAFYRRGALALGRNPAGFRFVVVERDPPYGLSVCAAAPSLEAFADDMVQQAIETWAACLSRDSWPSYPPHIAWIEAPSWAVMQHEERGLRARFSAEDRTRREAANARVMGSGSSFA